MNAHEMNSTLLCSKAIKVSFFHFSLFFLLQFHYPDLSPNRDREREWKNVHAYFSHVHFCTSLFSPAFSLPVVACVSVFCMCSMFIFLFSLCTDKIFCKWNTKKNYVIFYENSMRFSMIHTMRICSNFEQLSNTFGLYVVNTEQHALHIIAIWIHVTNEHTCKSAQNHVARKKATDRGANECERDAEQIKHLKWVSLWLHAACLFLCVCVYMNVLECTRTHTPSAAMLCFQCTYTHIHL